MRQKIQFTLSKLGIAWMFALVTLNFNRIAIHDLRLSGLMIAAMIGIYPLFGPLQPLFRRLTDRFPIFGYRRSPYLVLGMVGGALVFPPMPALLNAMKEGSTLAVAGGFVLFAFFGLMIALMANTFLDLVAECTTEETRGGIFAAAWTGQTAVMVLWAAVFSWLMPEAAQATAQMTVLYTITPFVVLAFALASVWGLEKPIGAPLPAGGPVAPEQSLNSLRSSITLLSGNGAARLFFVFIVLTFLGIFGQDLVQELMAADVFGLQAGRSALFQQIFNGMVTLGMSAGAIMMAKRHGGQIPFEAKKQLAQNGGWGAVLSFAILAAAILVQSLPGVCVGFGLIGLTVGIFTFASVTMMSDMTVVGQTAQYLGLWSIAQAIGLGSSFLLSGVIYSLLVDGLHLAPVAAYVAFFLLEGSAMAACVLCVGNLSQSKLRSAAKSPVYGQPALASSLIKR